MGMELVYVYEQDELVLDRSMTEHHKLFPADQVIRSIKLVKNQPASVKLKMDVGLNV